MDNLLTNLLNEDIKPIQLGEIDASFEEGYETYEFYNAILSSCKERLYIYGRKNRKLFTKNNTKLKELLNNNVDFKCLFLSDKSNASILKMAQDNDNFTKDLEKIINGVKDKYKDNIECFRKYDFQQLKRIIIVDGAVIVSPVAFENGRVKHFTKGAFKVYDAESVEGIDLIKEFKKIWNISNKL